MAASATRRSASPSGRRVIAVAYSAGRDSTALLHATLIAAAESGVQVAALHVHHDLSAHADHWLAQAQRQCERWARQGLPVRFIAHCLSSKPARGESIEAWARQARYRALRDMAIQAGADVVLLAHHRRDQAETLLLQALRGAGVAGLAGMPKAATRDGITWMRPWLSHSRDEIDAYVRHHRLKHIEDDSNADARFARNRLRLNVWPSLAEAFPQAEASLADAAAWAGEASACLNELAAIDLAQLSDASGLRIAAWQALMPARRVNALRVWLGEQMSRAPAASLLARLQRELPAEGAAQWEVPAGALRRHRGRLVFVAQELVAHDAPRQDAEQPTTLSVRRAGRYPLPGWGGVLEIKRVKEGGVPLALLVDLHAKAREGGEQFQAGVHRPARSLKKQYQAAGVPAWEREAPLFFCSGQLVFVPGLGIDARVAATAGVPQVALRWHRG